MPIELPEDDGTASYMRPEVREMLQRGEDLVDFPCSRIWTQHYASLGITADYPPKFYDTRDRQLQELRKEMEALEKEVERLMGKQPHSFGKAVKQSVAGYTAMMAQEYEDIGDGIFKVIKPKETKKETKPMRQLMVGYTADVEEVDETASGS